jgi:hypothetical protein
MPRRCLPLFALTVVSLFSHEAWAGTYDLDLTPLADIDTGSGIVTPQNERFRSLASEVGAVIAPRPVDPSDTLGLSGFAIAADIGINTISDDADYWTDTARGTPGGVITTLQVMGRKGLWPGVEIGAGGTKVFDSRMWAISGYGKVALHEGFHHLPIPTIGLRGMFSRLLGSKDLNITTASVDIALSHVFGVGSTFNLTPYIGYQTLFVLAKTGVIDSTPEQDELAEGGVRCDDFDPANPCFIEGEFVFKRQDAIIRHRPFLGLRFIFSVMRITVEYMFTVKGGSSDTVDLDGGGSQDVTDQSGNQHNISISVGLDF